VVVFSIAALFLNIGAAHGQKSRLMFHHGDPILIDPIYHTYAEVVAELDTIANDNPEITRLDTIGISTTDSSVILALKISDNPMIEEDEPAILYNGIHHANELMGAEICMYMIDSLVRGYGSDPQITAWVDSTEIWIVPIVNPDGHNVVMHLPPIDTSWRKNTRDNNGNDTFDIYDDGVDLNRNYDFNWHMAMGRDWWDRYYRGPYAFSELETQAIRDFSSDQHFIFAVNYHGPDLGVGEIIYYPWEWDGQQSPDSFAIKNVADSMALLIINDADDSTYAIGLGEATSPKARNWQYGVKGTFAYTVEVCTCFIPQGSLVTDLCQRNVVGAFYLLDRIHGASITGCITDSITRMPLQAEVRILEAYDPDLPPRMSDSLYGRYRRILNPDSTPTVTIVVYKEGYHPDTIENVDVLPDEPTICDIQLSHSPWIVYHSHSINDSINGNGDGFINPGESILMPVTLENIGDLTSHDVICTLRTSSSYITITDNVQSYGDIDPGSTAVSWGSYAFIVSDSCTSGYEIPFSLFIQDSDSNFWTWDAPDDSVVTADIVYESHLISDPPPGGNNNGQLNPDETAHMTVTLHNSGPSDLSDVNAVLKTSDPWVLFITDSSGSFGDIPAGSSSTNNVDHFAVSVYPSAPVGYQVRFSLWITGDGSTYVYEDTSNFSVIIGEPTIAAPTGPDEYGYWAYDDTDTLYGYAPPYYWFEIAPPGPGTIIPEITNTDGGMVTLDLPFTFKYYDTDYDSISVCSNGFLKLGSTSYTTGTGYNSSIPNDSGPNRMVAPFWDDLKADQYGEIYEYSDDTVYIIEFDSVNHRGLNPSYAKYETFQVILYNPDSYPTPTGDGEIVFLYQTVDAPDSNTVGIENHAETIGIQWLYNNNYDPAAAPLVPDRVIKFTTYVPITDSMPWVYVWKYMINDSTGGNNNGIPDPGETVDLIVYLANGGNSSANNVEATLQSSDPDITILDSFASFGDMPPGWQANNDSAPYSFEVVSAITDTLADFSLFISANQGSYQTVAYFTVALGPPLGIAEGEHRLPYTYALLQNYPNPMRNITTIRYQLPKKEKVSLKIYDVVGRLVKTLINELKEPGYYTIHWHGKDDRERKASAGVYFYRIQAGNYTNTKKMVLFK
jgi:hypothetical protein